MFPGQVLPFDADFFTELGGHSLIAARFVSAVRETPALSGMTLQDVYGQRTLRAMAAAARRARRRGRPGRAICPSSRRRLRRRFLCGLAQAVALPFILGLVTAQWLGLFLASVYLLQDDTGCCTRCRRCSASTSGSTSAPSCVIALKWLIIGRTRPGRYPLWGAYYFRVWLVQRLSRPPPSSSCRARR